MSNVTASEKLPSHREHNDKSFEALIDLLATDDNSQVLLAEKDVAGSDGLRDADGKLDFDKIHSLLSRRTQNIESSLPGTLSNSRSIGPSDVTFLQDNPSNYSHGRSFSPNVGANMAVRHDSNADSCQHCMSAHCTPAEENTLDPPIVNGHAKNPTKQSQGAGDVSPGDNISQTLEAVHPPPDLPRHGLLEPLEVSALTQALSLANKEILELRQRSDALHSLLSDRLPLGNGNSELRSAVPSQKLPLPMNAEILPEFAVLNEEQSKQLLTALTRSLALSPSSLLSNIPSPPWPPQQSPRSVADVQRALDFVVRTDDIIWRRTSYSPALGRIPAAVFDEDNTLALLERLRLWERALRRHRESVFR